MKRLAGRARARALAPVLERLELMDAHAGAQLADLSRRVGEMELVLQVLDGRAATTTERSVMLQESGARLARRLEAVEQALAETGRVGRPTDTDG